jgi:hypothetical protein
MVVLASNISVSNPIKNLPILYVVSFVYIQRSNCQGCISTVKR